MANKVCSVLRRWRKPGRPHFGEAVFPTGALVIVAPEAKTKQTLIFLRQGLVGLISQRNNSNDNSLGR